VSELEDAWNAVHRALPEGWRVNRPEHLDDLHRWQVVEADYRAGRKQPDYVIGEGMTEAHALRGPASLLRAGPARRSTSDRPDALRSPSLALAACRTGLRNGLRPYVRPEDLNLARVNR
jgi:hypothetical protein